MGSERAEPPNAAARPSWRRYVLALACVLCAFAANELITGNWFPDGFGRWATMLLTGAVGFWCAQRVLKRLGVPAPDLDT